MSITAENMPQEMVDAAINAYAKANEAGSSPDHCVVCAAVAVAPLIAEQARREEREACAALVGKELRGERDIVEHWRKANAGTSCDDKGLARKNASDAEFRAWGVQLALDAIRSRGDQSPPPALSKDGIRIHCPDMSPGWDPTVGYQGGCHLVECGCGAEGPAVPDDYDEAVRLWNAGYRASDQEAVDRRSGDQSAALDDIAKFDQDEGLI